MDMAGPVVLEESSLSGNRPAYKMGYRVLKQLVCQSIVLYRREE